MIIDELKTLVLKASKKLSDQQLKLVTAESCTGGGLSYWLTSVPGSSAWFERGFVTYCNTAKIEMLNVQPSTLEQFGAVSEETAREMAQGALINSHADISIAITGIAGPDGGTKEKPVGLIWIAWMKRNEVIKAEMNIFSGDRQQIRLQAMAKALEKII